ncbi:MAG: hypothetical protein K2X87_21245 [Gemmataceae bacterium]|nr:hypothetical protein [Gemmataceae bacterium]
MATRVWLVPLTAAVLLAAGGCDERWAKADDKPADRRPDPAPPPRETDRGDDRPKGREDDRPKKPKEPKEPEPPAEARPPGAAQAAGDLPNPLTADDDPRVVTARRNAEAVGSTLEAVAEKVRAIEVAIAAGDPAARADQAAAEKQLKEAARGLQALVKDAERDADEVVRRVKALRYNLTDAAAGYRAMAAMYRGRAARRAEEFPELAALTTRQAEELERLAADVPERIKQVDEFLVALDKNRNALAELGQLLAETDGYLRVVTAGPGSPLGPTPEGRAAVKRLRQFLGVMEVYGRLLSPTPPKPAPKPGPEPSPPPKPGDRQSQVPTDRFITSGWHTRPFKAGDTVVGCDLCGGLHPPPTSQEREEVRVEEQCRSDLARIPLDALPPPGHPRPQSHTGLSLGRPPARYKESVTKGDRVEWWCAACQGYADRAEFTVLNGTAKHDHGKKAEREEAEGRKALAGVPGAHCPPDGHPRPTNGRVTGNPPAYSRLMNHGNNQLTTNTYWWCPGCQEYCNWQFFTVTDGVAQHRGCRPAPKPEPAPKTEPAQSAATPSPAPVMSWHSPPAGGTVIAPCPRCGQYHAPPAPPVVQYRVTRR